MNSSVESLKKHLFEIWLQAGIRDDEWAPLIPHLPDKGCVLFVGMNPSFSKRGWNKVVGESDAVEFDPYVELAWGNRANLDLPKLMKIEKNALETHSYFRVFNVFGKAAGCAWDHIDLFQYRHTNQRVAEARLLASTSPLKLTPFGAGQLEVSMCLIEESQPRAIISVNASGSRILQNAKRPAFDPETGCHWLVINGARVPVFFSSMLTGQRALDVFSRTRLFWHVSRVLGIPFSEEPWGSVALPDSEE